MKEGGLVPVVVTLDLLKEAMHKVLADKASIPGFLIDGFPRELSQAKAFLSKVHAPDFFIATTQLTYVVSTRLRFCSVLRLLGSRDA